MPILYLLPPTTPAIMNPSHAGLPHPGALTNMLHPGFGDVGNHEYDTLIFDAYGRICGGGAAADSLFGAGRSRISGRLISEFIPDMRVAKTSPGHHALSAAALCERLDWQHIEARDVLGRTFTIAIRLSRRMTSGQEVFVLNFHRPGQALFSPTAFPRMAGL